jgi:nucleotide-binding universal stress UspA family protein
MKQEAIMHKINERKTFSKILAAKAEFRTTNSDKIVDYAINIAQDYDAQLIILHVIRADTKLHGINPPSHIIKMREEAQAHFAKITERIHENSTSVKGNTLKIRTEIIASIRIADAIVSYAEDKHIDLIIVGTRGRSKLKSVLLGSVASDVIRYAHCPVLTITNY